MTQVTLYCSKSGASDANNLKQCQLTALACRRRITADSLESQEADLPAFAKPFPEQNVGILSDSAVEDFSKTLNGEVLVPDQLPLRASNSDNEERQVKLREALMVQIEMQKHLHHQLEVSIRRKLPSRLQRRRLMYALDQFGFK